VLGLGILLAGLTIQYTIKSGSDRSAFVRWRNQLHDFGAGKDLYLLHVYPNAPMMAMIMYPFALLPKVTVQGLTVDLGALSWFYLKIGLTVLTFHWVFRLVAQQGYPCPPWAKLAVVLLSLRPIMGDLSHGNINLVILFLLVATLHAFRKGWNWTAGLALALSMTKVTSLLFLPYFFWKRAWKTLFACAAGLWLFFLILPSLPFGPDHNSRLLHSWVDEMILPHTVGGEVTTEHINQSLPGLIYRLATDSPSFYDDRDRPIDQHNWWSLPRPAARALVVASGLLFGVLVLATCRTPTHRRDDWRLAAEYSLVILGMLLFSERTWKHHCVTLVLPYAVLCYYLAVFRPPPLLRGYIVGSIVAALVLMSTTSTSLWGGEFGYGFGAKLALVYGAYAWAELILVAVLATLLLRHRTPRPGAAVSPGLFPSGTVMNLTVEVWLDGLRRRLEEAPAADTPTYPSQTR
jgi:hypothetical protein